MKNQCNQTVALIPPRMPRGNNVLLGCFLLGLTATAWCPISASGGNRQTQVENAAETLRPGEVRLGDLSPGKTRSFLVRVEAGQTARLSVEPVRIGLRVSIVDPARKILLEKTIGFGSGNYALSWVAEEPGLFQLDVAGKDVDACPGGFSVKLVEVVAASSVDRTVFELLKLEAEYQARMEANDFTAGLTLLDRMQTLADANLPAEHPEKYWLSARRGKLYVETGEYAKAFACLEQALAFFERRGDDELAVLRLSNDLGEAALSRNDFDKAEQVFGRAMRLVERPELAEHHQTARLLGNHAELFRFKGDYVKAETLQLRALALREKLLCPDDQNIGISLNNLAVMYKTKGDFTKAEQLYLRTLTIWEKRFGPDHLRIAAVLNNLGLVRVAMKKWSDAEPLFERALAIWRDKLGEFHPNVATGLMSLAEIAVRKKDFDAAEKLLVRAVEIDRKTVGPESVYFSNSTQALANVYRLKGEFKKAEAAYLESTAVRERTFDFSHPIVAGSLNALARIRIAQGDIAGAISDQKRANESRELELQRNLLAGSENQKFLHLKNVADETNQTISLHVQYAPDDQAAKTLAFETILRRKGRALDVMTDTIGKLRKRATHEDQVRLDELARSRQRLSRLTLQGPGRTPVERYREELRKLQEEVDRLENEISLSSAEYRVGSRPVTLDAVREALGPGRALVEFALYRPFAGNKENERPSRYVAYVLHSDGKTDWFDLGESEEIDRRVEALRGALRNPFRKDIRRLSRELDERLMRPIRKALGSVKGLVVSPEGVLNLVPFGALSDEKNKWLIETYSISYVTSGRDLLRLNEHVPGGGTSHVFADPDFGHIAGAGEESRRGLVLSEKIGGPVGTFAPLPGTEAEARALRGILPKAVVLTGPKADEKSLKQVSGPEILHIATHGFFIERDRDFFRDARGLVLEADAGAKHAKTAVNLMTLSGLALANANLVPADGEDGIVTALEIAGLDLWGTKMVVLSACETGLGEVRTGEGVYGLRRALLLAGSESQVISLWQVGDQATKELMTGFYSRLMSGASRADALRGIQLRMLADSKTKHPFFWAGFIQSGDWRGWRVGGAGYGKITFRPRISQGS